MTTLLLEIVTPDGIAFSEEVQTLTVPSADGELGILPGHVPLFAKLVEGEVQIETGKERLFLSIGGGFLETTGRKTSVLVTKAVNADKLNETAILEAKKEAERVLKEGKSDAEMLAAKALLRSSLVDLKVLERHRHRSRKRL